MTRITSIALSFLLLFTSSGFSQTANPTAARDTAEIQARVKKFAESKKLVAVYTISGQRSKGKITSFNSDGFTLADHKSGREETFRYADVSKVDKSGWLSTGSIIAFAAVGAGAVIVLTFVGLRCRNEGGC